MSGWCRRVLWVLAALYLIALALFVIGTFGLFASPSGPLAGVFLLPLAWPWILWADAAPPPLRPWLAALLPLANVALLFVLCRLRQRRAATH